MRPARRFPSRSPWLATGGALLLIALAGLLAYANSFAVPFVFDDRPSIVDHPLLKDWARFIGGEGYRYNPRRFVGYLSLALNYRFGGLDPVGYHAVNLTIHLTSAALVYALGRVLLATPALRTTLPARHGNALALVAALLFVAHPVQTQAVTYIVQRMASLATLFYLLAVVLYGWGRVKLGEQGTGIRDQEKTLPIPRVLPYVLFAGALLSAILALRSKEIAFTLPLAVLLVEVTCFRAPWRRRLWLLAPVAATAAFAALSLLGTGKPLGDLLADAGRLTRETELISRHDYLLTQFRVIATYLRLLILPVNQNIDYDYPIATTLFEPAVFFSFLLLAGLIGATGWLFWKSGDRKTVESLRRRFVNLSTTQPLNHSTTQPAASQTLAGDPGLRLIAFGLAWFFVALSIESSIIPIRDVIFEHRLYLPSVGMALVAATLWTLLLERFPSGAWTVAAMVTVLLLTATWQRNQVWGDELALWQDAAAKSPGKARVLNNLGMAYGLAGRADEAIAQFRTALNLHGPEPDILANLAVNLNRAGHAELALQAYRDALTLAPNHAVALTNLGVLIFQGGDREEGFRLFQEALRAGPDQPQVHFNLALAYRKSDNLTLAIEHYQRAIRLDPDYANAYNNLGSVYHALGRYGEAESHFRKAVELQPGNGNFRRNLEQVLAARP